MCYTLFIGTYRHRAHKKSSGRTHTDLRVVVDLREKGVGEGKLSRKRTTTVAVFLFL